MTNSTAGDDWIGTRRDDMSCGSKKIAFASVSLSEWMSPSSPRVAYAVTIGIDCDAAAMVNKFFTVMYLEQLVANAPYIISQKTFNNERTKYQHK
jgi:hypothetical protein